MMSSPIFLLVDDVAENRYLVSKTLLRKFPAAKIVEFEESEPALAAARHEPPTAIVVHRTSDLDGPTMVRQLRQMNATVPIIVVSGRETFPEAIEAGATAFLNYEAWLRIGTVMEEILSPQYVKPITASPFVAKGDFLGMRRSDG
jgi:CheY-like chemotaxis protein